MSQQPPPGPPEGWDRPSGEPTQPLGQGSGQQPPAQPQGPPTGQQPQWGQPPGQQAHPGWGPPPAQPKSPDRRPWYQRFWWAIAIGAFILGGLIGAGGSGADPQAAPETVTVTSIQRVARYEPLCSNYLDEEDQRLCEQRESKKLGMRPKTRRRPQQPQPRSRSPHPHLKRPSVMGFIRLARTSSPARTVRSAGATATTHDYGPMTTRTSSPITSLRDRSG